MPVRKVYLETFGCQMNELDSELVAGQLRSMGYEFTAAPETADVVLYNTCSVREHAEQKVWSRLGELKLRKVDEPGLVVGVLGCMAERDGTDLIKRMPVVDILCGPGELDKLPMLLDNAVRTRESLLSEPPLLGLNGIGIKLVSADQVALQGSTSRRSGTLAAAEDTLELLDLSRAISPTDHKGSAYVRITRGCNKFCTYCVVPFTRGAEVHRPPDHIVDECKRLADSGVLEITLLGQTVNHYRFEHGSAVMVNGLTQPQKGRSYKGGHRRDPFASSQTTTFADLLARIHDEAPGIQRLRFVTSYPRDFGDDVLEVIRDHPRICRYLHVPAQSGSNRILQMMNRGYTIEEYLEFLDRARSYLHQPAIGRPLTIAGDIINGFPTETEEDHLATASLLERAKYKNCFIFKYSPRPGTVAFDKLPDDVPEDVKRRRNNELLDLQTRISLETSLTYVGSTVSVFVEGLSRKEHKRQRPGDPAPRAEKHTHGSVGLTISGKAVNALPIGGTPPTPAIVESDDACCTTAVSPVPPPSATIQLCGRTDGDLIVFFDLPRRDGLNPDDLVGKIVPVKITDAMPLSLIGALQTAS
ncbi:MAG: MiaB/RimO family radical SAM methylthiotransferase [Pyrinomonadaceae bacterium]|nr:MiaB/RimO family radical SAM methylthiotransferase [Phycisphaerales bacterium]